MQTDTHRIRPIPVSITLPNHPEYLLTCTPPRKSNPWPAIKRTNRPSTWSESPTSSASIEKWLLDVSHQTNKSTRFSRHHELPQPFLWPSPTAQSPVGCHTIVQSLPFSSRGPIPSFTSKRLCAPTEAVFCHHYLTCHSLSRLQVPSNWLIPWAQIYLPSWLELVHPTNKHHSSLCMPSVSALW